MDYVLNQLENPLKTGAKTQHSPNSAHYLTCFALGAVGGSRLNRHGQTPRRHNPRTHPFSPSVTASTSRSPSIASTPPRRRSRPSAAARCLRNSTQLVVPKKNHKKTRSSEFPNGAFWFLAKTCSSMTLFSPTAESFGVSAQIGSGVVRVPRGFHQGSTRVPRAFHDVLRGLPSTKKSTACC